MLSECWGKKAKKPNQPTNQSTKKQTALQKYRSRKLES